MGSVGSWDCALEFTMNMSEHQARTELSCLVTQTDSDQQRGAIMQLNSVAITITIHH